MTSDEVRPGITVLVSKGGDLSRSATSYRLAITAVHWVGYDKTTVNVSGRISRVDGTPTTARRVSRIATLRLAKIEVVED